MLLLLFDLTERSFSDILLPDDMCDEYDICNLAVLGDFLCVHVFGYDDFPAKIWVMKEYKIQSSWTKRVDVPVDEIPTKYFSLICSTKSGDIVGKDGNNGLVKYNSEGQLLEHRSYRNGRGDSLVAVYTESLLSLPYDGDQGKNTTMVYSDTILRSEL